MKCNVAWPERSVRALIGLPALFSYFYLRHFSMPWAYGMVCAGLTLFATAAWGWCPLYQALVVTGLKKMPQVVPSNELEA